MSDKKQEAIPQKAGLVEIFAALNGICSAGVAMSILGETTKHELVNLACDVAGKSWDLKAIIGAKEGKIDHETNEGIAAKALKILQDAQVILADYQTLRLSDPHGRKGGTVQSLSEHIDSILKREAVAGSSRPIDQFKAAAHTARPFEAPYLPNYYTEKKEKTGSSPKAASPAQAPALV